MFNNTIAGVPVSLAEAPAHLLVPCEHCRMVEAEFAVGHTDHKLVCESCLAWGDSRRWWNLEPRQVIGGMRLDFGPDGRESNVMYWRGL